MSSRIVVLDGFTLNPGDLSWDDLKTLGSCEVFDRIPPEQTVVRARDAEDHPSTLLLTVRSTTS